MFPPIQSFFIPQARLIENVTVGQFCEVTTTAPHFYETGYVVRVIVPPVYGMVLDYVQTIITVTGDTTFTTQIDTSNQFPFSPPTFTGTNPYTPAQCIPMTGVEVNIANFIY